MIWSDGGVGKGGLHLCLRGVGLVWSMYVRQAGFCASAPPESAGRRGVVVERFSAVTSRRVSRSMG